MLVGQLRGGILEFFGQTGKLLFVCRAGPIAAVGVAAAEQRAHPVGDGDDVLGVAVCILAIAEECDALKAHVGHAGADDVAILVLLHTKAQVGVLALICHVFQSFQLLRVLCIHGDTPVAELAVIALALPGKGDVQAVRPGKDEVLAVPAVHALDDACGQSSHRLAQRHRAGADGVALAL